MKLIRQFDKINVPYSTGKKFFRIFLTKYVNPPRYEVEIKKFQFKFDEINQLSFRNYYNYDNFKDAFNKYKELKTKKE